MSIGCTTSTTVKTMSTFDTILGNGVDYTSTTYNKLLDDITMITGQVTDVNGKSRTSDQW